MRLAETPVRYSPFSHFSHLPLFYHFYLFYHFSFEYNTFIRYIRYIKYNRYNRIQDYTLCCAVCKRYQAIKIDASFPVGREGISLGKKSRMGKCKDAWIDMCNEQPVGEVSAATTATPAATATEERESCYACVRNKAMCSIHDKAPAEPRKTIVFRRVQEFELTFAEWRKHLMSAEPYDERWKKAKLLPIWKRMCNQANGVVVLEDDDVPPMEWADVETASETLFEEAEEAE